MVDLDPNEDKECLITVLGDEDNSIIRIYRKVLE